jgi:hypothetical protein
MKGDDAALPVSQAEHADPLRLGIAGRPGRGRSIGRALLGNLVGLRPPARGPADELTGGG